MARGGRGRPGEGTLNESHLIIDGKVVGPPAAPAFERRNPVSDAVVTRAAAGGVAEARRAATAAAAAFPGWSATPAPERAAVLARAAQVMADRREEAVAFGAAEIGSAPAWIRYNVDLAVEMLRQAAGLAPLVGERAVDDPSGERHLIRRRPAGVVVGIAPWNAAVTLATRALAAPLACGNTVVLKGSELCPMTHEWVARAVNDAGLPPGVLNFITNAPDHAEEVVEALIAHEAVRRVTFTGSTRVGREIALQAARHLKPCLLELSGKGTTIVLADADLDAAARAAAHGSFFNQGQICMSTERILVEERVADAFARRFAAEAGRLAAEAPLGSLISASAALRQKALVEDALARGAVLVAGGGIANAEMAPTILDHVAPGMRIYAEEAFGPIAGIVRFGDAEEALSLANDTDFGLVASVFSADIPAAEAMLRQVETGIGHVNRSTVHDDPRMPFGGLKASGWGRFGGEEALREFTECQWITTRTPDAPGGPS